MDMKPEFVYETDESHVTFSAYCGSPADALFIQSELGTLCGSQFTREGDLLSVRIALERKDEAILELETAGYPTANDFLEYLEPDHLDI